MERVQRTSGGARSASGTVVDARASLALWLRAGRAQKNMSLDDVAKVTKIQSRILERLEAGKFDGLPAEVFVRGFVRSFARCVGLDEDEALKRYTACTKAEPPPSAKAFVESMSELAPASASTVTGFRATPVVVESVRTTAELPVVAPPVDEPVEIGMLPEMGTLAETPAASSDLVVEAIQAEASSEIAVAPIQAIAESLVERPSKKKKRGGRNKTQSGQLPSRSRRKQLATGTPVEATPVVVEVAPPAPAADPAAPIIAMLPITTATIETATPETIAPAPSSAVELRAPEAAPAEAKAEPVATAAAAEAFANAVAAKLEQPAVEAAAPVEIPAEIPHAIEVVEAPPAALPHDDEPAVGGVWSPKMPVVAQVTAPWRLSRGVRATTLAPVVVPSLVIDDADPEVADKQREERLADKDSRPRARSFLPPILLDRDDRSGRQGGLTLAVIILLIAATLTLSYLMRRPSASGDGYTLRDTPASAIHLG